MEGRLVSFLVSIYVRLGVQNPEPHVNTIFIIILLLSILVSYVKRKTRVRSHDRCIAQEKKGGTNVAILGDVSGAMC